MDLEDDKGSSIEEGEVLEEGEIDDDDENVERTVSFLGNVRRDGFGPPPDDFPPAPGPLRVDFRQRYDPHGPRGDTGFHPPRNAPDPPGEWRFRELLSRRGRGFGPEGVSFHGAMNLGGNLGPPPPHHMGRGKGFRGRGRGRGMQRGGRGGQKNFEPPREPREPREGTRRSSRLRNRPDHPLQEAEPWLPWMKKYFGPNKPDMGLSATPRDVGMTMTSMSSLSSEGPLRRQDQQQDTGEQYSDLLQNYRRIRSQLEEIERKEKLEKMGIREWDLDKYTREEKTSRDTSPKGEGQESKAKGRSRSRSKSGSSKASSKSEPKQEADAPKEKKEGEDEDDDEELMELQLRLIALESAAKARRDKTDSEDGQAEVDGGKEQSPEGKDTTLKLEQDKVTAGSLPKKNVTKSGARKSDQSKPPAVPPRQLTTSPFNMNRRQSKRKRGRPSKRKRDEIRLMQKWKEGEEERERTRRTEAARIRNLGNHAEQYKRFMEFVTEARDGSPHPKQEEERRRRSRSAERATSARPSPAAPLPTELQDNYEEVSMDVDSNDESPEGVLKKETFLFPGLPPDLPFVPPLPLEAPPEVPPPPEPTDLIGEDQDEEEDDDDEDLEALRGEVFKSLVSRRALKETPSPREGSPFEGNSPGRDPQQTQAPSYTVRRQQPPRLQQTIPMIPVHGPVVINLGDDSDESDEDEGAKPAGSSWLDDMLKAARRDADAAKAKPSPPPKKATPVPKTPEALIKLDLEKQQEYRRLKEEIARRERSRLEGSQPSSAAASPSVSEVETGEDDAPLTDTTSQEGQTPQDKPHLKDGSLPKIDESESGDVKTEEEKGEDFSKEEELRQRLLEKNAAEWEGRVEKHSDSVRKDQRLLDELSRQVSIKEGTVRAAQVKVQKLKEQLQAAEKILSGSRALVKRLQDQTITVQQRLDRKQATQRQLVEGLNKARIAAGKSPSSVDLEEITVTLKRKQPLPSEEKGNKKAKTQRTAQQRMSPQSIVLEKERLQRLEREYAEKIRQLKEAMESKTPRVDKEAVKVEVGKENLQPTNVLQPVVDYTQDKISLSYGGSAKASSSNVEVEKEHATEEKSKRRKSLLELNPSTKPQLLSPDRRRRSSERLRPRTQESESSQDAQSESAATSEEKTLNVRLPAGQEMETLRRLQTEKEKKLPSTCSPSNVQFLKEFSVLETPVCKDLDLRFDPVTSGPTDQSDDLLPLPLRPYSSCLLNFRSYRFNPYFRTKSKLPLTSATFGHKVNPQQVVCRFHLTGTCNDGDCRWQHLADAMLTGDEVYQDLLSYHLPLVGVTETTEPDKCQQAIVSFVEKTCAPNKDKMSENDQCLLLVSQVNEHAKHVPPHTTFLHPRVWRPAQARRRELREEESGEGEDRKFGKDVLRKTSPPSEDLEFRYFISEGETFESLEAAALKDPQNSDLWIGLAHKYLKTGASDENSRLDQALNVLSRGLEANQCSEALWLQYLELYSRRSGQDEALEMCQQAVEFAPSYRIWWKYLSLQDTIEAKDSVCCQILEFLRSPEFSGEAESRSHSLLETLLYRTQLGVVSGQRSRALQILQDALKQTKDTPRPLTCDLTPEDRVLCWLCFINLQEFHTLPPHMWDPADSNPGRIVCKEPFLMSWSEERGVTTPRDSLLSHFQDALRACSSKTQAAQENTLVCLPLYRNLVLMERVSNKVSSARGVCKRLLKACPGSVPLCLLLADVEARHGTNQDTLNVLQDAASRHERSAEVHLALAKCLLTQGDKESALGALVNCVEAFFNIKDSSEDHSPQRLYSKLLGQPLPLGYTAPPYADGVDHSTVRGEQLYLYLNYSLLLDLQGDSAGSAEVYESAICSLTNTSDVQTVWMEYLKHHLSRLQSGQDKMAATKTLRELTNRCLVSMPTSFPRQHSQGHWQDYSFHNKVIDLFVGCLEKGQRSTAYENFLRMMPNNVNLNLRAVEHAFATDDLQLARSLLATVSKEQPLCVGLWQLAVHLHLQDGNINKVSRLYKQATRLLPHHAPLWKDYILFEAVYGGKEDRVNTIISRCRQQGVNVEEYLSTIFKTSSTSSKS
ncbi:ZFC3H1 [Branchiostoma lanceolatum]|uniref:ZFC3H1 protein n=1 Tax=Branchiostoma lanceolatum TaxID=7740 RepID=A0A8K0EJI6_BRALA|nr:ZFC3H1 [Branchiostoma lanceolatum]